MSDDILYMQCPPVQADRVSLMYNTIERWIRSSALARLVEQFGSRVPSETNVQELVSWLLDFSDRWDFRRMQQQAAAKDTGEAARWLLDNSQLTPELTGIIYESARTLGLIGVGHPTACCYDYVLVLGGARLSCLLRPRLAAQMIRDTEMKPKAVFMLASSRPVSDSERDATDTYAPNAATEFDLMNVGAEASFQMEPDHTEECFDSPDNTNSNWKIRHYWTVGRPFGVVSMSAPSLQPDVRRANSSDTYEFCFSRFGIERGSSLLLVTSEIYVPYQQVEAIRTLALPHEVTVETVGFPAEWGGQLQGMAGPTNYLQEMRSTIQAAHRFVESCPQK